MISATKARPEKHPQLHPIGWQSAAHADRDDGHIAGYVVYRGFDEVHSGPFQVAAILCS